MKRRKIFIPQRFTKNTFYVEKNPTIVNFPVKNIDLSDYLTEEVRQHHPSPVYDLVANIVHDGNPDGGTYRCHILHKGTGKWYELQDLHVKEIEPQMLTLTESYIQIFERQKSNVQYPAVVKKEK
ncbi:U4/U6.U5 tri-snRNP-associated protein 2 [Armadillidium nasatum]|uniref:ubiquitinyl hydrolase 1 n=1 Tax=Armadillidium nasatum TaxID=96803 RepID=A0A5N5TAJ4_9CRUS|nr:U4/U6.U5 tri-snRNP-associated protein 2 [Armadillidium nasatum]